MTPTAKLILLYVQTHGPVSIDEIRDEFNIPFLQLYPVAGFLVNAGDIERRKDVLCSLDSD